MLFLVQAQPELSRPNPYQPDHLCGNQRKYCLSLPQNYLSFLSPSKNWIPLYLLYLPEGTLMGLSRFQ